MRSTYRMALAALLGALALSAAATATASATTPEWYYHGHALSTKPAEGGLGAGEETTSATVTGPVKLNVHGLGSSMVIECKKLTLPGSRIKSVGSGRAESLTFKECVMNTTPKTCTVPKNITTAAVNTELFYVNGTEVWDEYKPGNGVFATIPIEECALEGNYQLIGSFCGKETSPSTETVSKEQVFGVLPSGTGARTCTANYFGTHSTTLEATAAFSLSGSQLGAVWTGK